MFNPFEGSAEIVRIKVNDLGTRIEENEEFYIYEIIQSINEAEEIVGTIKVPKDTFIVDGELLYCLEDGVPEVNYVKGDAYIRLKVVTEEFKKDENGNILPDTTEKYYKYINILVTDLLNIPLTVIKVEYKNDSDTTNGISNVVLKEEISEDGRIRTYTLVIERTTFVKDVSINDTNNLIESSYAIAGIVETTENPEHQSFEIKKVELPTKLPNPEPLTFLPNELPFDGSKKIEFEIIDGFGTNIETITTENSVKYKVNSEVDIELANDNNANEQYIFDIERVYESDGGITIKAKKDDFENLVFYCNNNNTGFKYSPTKNKTIDITSGKNIEVNYSINNNNEIEYTIKSLLNTELEEDVGNTSENFISELILEKQEDNSLTLKKTKTEFNNFIIKYNSDGSNKDMVYEPGGDNKITIKSGENIDIKRDTENSNDKNNILIINSKTDVTIDEVPQNNNNLVIKNIKDISEPNSYDKHFAIETLEVATLEDIPEIPTELPNKETLLYTVLNKNNSVLGDIEYKGDIHKEINIKEGNNITIKVEEDDTNKLVYNIEAKDTPDTHYEGKNIISTSTSTLNEKGAITNGNLKINYIEGYLNQEKCQSSIPIIGEDGIQVIKNANDNTIIVNAKEIQSQLENGIKNPKPYVFTDGKTNVVYNGSEQKQAVIKEGDNIHVGSESITNGGAYTINAEDTNYKIIITTEDSPLNDINGVINNEELQMRLIEISQTWDETTQKFIEKENVKKVIPLSGVNRTQVYKKSGDSTVYIDTPSYNFGDGFEYSDNDVDLKFDVDGWTIDAGKISHYCTCTTAKDISTKDVYSSKPFTYENGTMIVVRFSEGNAGYVNINFNGKTVPVYQGNVQYKTDFRMNTTLWLMYYNNGVNDYWLLIGAPSVQETKNVITSSSLGTSESGTITNGNVYLNHLNDYQVKSSHLIKGENGIEVTADGNEISITAPDVDVVSLDEGGITSLNYGAAFTVDSVSSGNNPHEIIVEKKHFKLPDAPTSTGGGEHYIAKHVLSDSPTGTTPMGELTGTSDNPIYLNLIDGTENTKHISSLAIYGSGSTKVSTDSRGDELIIDSSQQDYGIANEDNPGLIKDGGDISVNEEGDVTVNVATSLRGSVYLDGLLLEGTDFTKNKKISSFVWCSVSGNETSKTITLSQPCNLYNGLTLKVGFTNDNTAPNPYLYITNGGKSAPIYYKGNPTPTNLIKANYIYILVYYNDAFHITNVNENTITTIKKEPHSENAAIIGFAEAIHENSEIYYRPIYKEFATTDTNSKTIIDTTTEPNIGTPIVTSFDTKLELSSDTTIYTPNYSTLENSLPNAMEITGEEIIDVIQENNDNKPNWKVSHKITDGRYGENKTSSVTGVYQSSDFGQSVIIPNIYYDKFGHIISTNSAQIQLPSIEQIPVRYGLEIEKEESDGKFYIQHTNNILGGTVGVNNGASILDYGDSFNIPQITYDNQGHIKETYEKNFTLPEAPPEQKLYRGINGISVDNNNYTIGHTNSIAASNTVKNETTSLSYDSTFKIPVITYDSEGHITKKEEQTLTLPPIPDYSEIPNTPEIPSALLLQGDDIININKRGNTREFKHKKSTKQQGTSFTKSLKFGESFEIETLTSDDYGHITEGTKTTIKLPPIPDYSEIPNTPNIPEQKFYNSGTAINVDNESMTIKHENVAEDVKLTSKTIGANSTDSLSHGSSFIIPKITYNKQGHIIKTEDKKLTLPSVTFIQESYPSAGFVLEMKTFGGEENIVNDVFLSKYHNLTIYFDNRDGIDLRYMHGNITIPCALLKDVYLNGTNYELAVGVQTTSVNDSTLKTLDAYSYQSISISLSSNFNLQFKGKRDIRSHGDSYTSYVRDCKLGNSLWIFS